MKVQEREEACRFRLEEGSSIKAIALKLGVAKSSVSLWVRGIQLTDEQKAKLYCYSGERVLKGARAIEAKCRELRLQYQTSGRLKAKERDPDHVAGCMLYWAEGSKNRGSVIFTNSEYEMMRFFLSFLRRYYSVSNENVRFKIRCHADVHTLEEIENHWLTLLGLPSSCLLRSVVDYYGSTRNAVLYNAQKRKGKLPYGVGILKVHDTRIVQHIYGAIQEYSGFDKMEWLNC